MAVLHKKEEKIQAVLGRLPKKYTEEQFLEMFIRLYSKDWGKIKSAYIKQSQDKEPGTIINMPKPDVYLKQVLAIYLQNAAAPKADEVKEEVIEVPTVAVKKTKAPAKEKTEEPAAELKKVKAPAKKKAEKADEPVAEVKKAKAPAKKKTEVAEESSVETKKPKAAAKKPAAKK
ncbi:hypothetical protein ACS5PU_14185 [Pedobacter sp. GSP4]|uniref:hypothetical protein n=1 Tax=Pedobacter sp. GSP4 TaxID=3453716 RepID=UPI003EE88F66